MAVHPGSIWLESHWAQLHQDVWLAANATGIVAEAQDVVDLYSKLQLLGVKLAEVTIAYVPSGVIQ